MTNLICSHIYSNPLVNAIAVYSIDLCGIVVSSQESEAHDAAKPIYSRSVGFQGVTPVV